MNACDNCGYYTRTRNYTEGETTRALCDVCYVTFLSKAILSNDVSFARLAQSIGWLANAFIDAAGKRAEFEMVLTTQSNAEAGEVYVNEDYDVPTCDVCGETFTPEEWEDRHQPHFRNCARYRDSGAECSTGKCNSTTHALCCWMRECQ